MKIYDDYMQAIREAVNSDPSNVLSKGLGAPNFKRSRETFSNINSKIKDDHIALSMRPLLENLDRTINYNQQLGLHPDFSHLKNTDITEEHYIVSAFIDVKGSTNLFKKFDKETNFLIVNTLLKAGIHTMLIFGGYVHRLMGDGMFVYFGGKGKDKKHAIENSLRAISVYTHFVQNDLKEYLLAQGIENISVRTGVDLGYDKDVLWAYSGIGNISEVTTCSLHTSLASKMQSSAKSNGVVAGQHIKNELLEGEEYFTTVSNRTNNENDRYIFRIDDKNFYYTQFDFNWERFLKKQNFIATDMFGNPTIKAKKDYSSRSIADLKPIATLSKPFYSNE